MTEESVAAEAAAEEQLQINRREFLNLAWLASLGFLTLQLGGYTLAFTFPRFKEGEFGGIFTYGPVDDVPEINVPPENFPKVKM